MALTGFRPGGPPRRKRPALTVYLRGRSRRGADGRFLWVGLAMEGRHFRSEHFRSEHCRERHARQKQGMGHGSSVNLSLAGSAAAGVAGAADGIADRIALGLARRGMRP